MKINVAVDKSLSPVSKLLKDNGYKITDMKDKSANAIIVDGLDDNFMGMEDIVNDVPVINAQGKTAEEILKELESKL